MRDKFINAKQEYLRATKNYKVIAASVNLYTLEGELEFKLNPLYTKDEYDNFLNFLDVDYDNGYGGQNLFGVIFCENGVWMQRGEYDGSEWWDIFKYPDLRESFDENIVLKYERSKKLRNIKDIIE